MLENYRFPSGGHYLVNLFGTESDAEVNKNIIDYCEKASDDEIYGFILRNKAMNAYLVLNRAQAEYNEYIKHVPHFVEDEGISKEDMKKYVSNSKYNTVMKEDGTILYTIRRTKINDNVPMKIELMSYLLRKMYNYELMQMEGGSEEDKSIGTGVIFSQHTCSKIQEITNNFYTYKFIYPDEMYGSELKIYGIDDGFAQVRYSPDIFGELYVFKVPVCFFSSMKLNNDGKL